MSEDLFQREYLCKWTPNKAYEEAYKLRISYEYKCEYYDRTVCLIKVRDDGVGFFPSHEEYKLSNIYACERMREMKMQIYDYNSNNEDQITDEILQTVRREVNRMTWGGVQREYKRLFE